MLRFRKVHGTGNDFILVTGPAADRDWPGMARALCARRTGVGADGLVVSARLSSCPPRYQVSCFNADGSEASMCGNALRCAALCAARDYGDSEMSLAMAGTEHRAVVCGADVAITAEAGPVTSLLVEVGWEETVFGFDAVHTGTEHVVAVVADVDKVDVEGCGRLVRHHRNVAPAGTNVNFVQVDGPAAVRVRTYERGVEAETLSCGSGAVAAVVVAQARRLIGDGQVTVGNQARAPLTVRPDAAGGGTTFWVSGPAAVVCHGEIS
jgi:diaminopimelate epimerase